MPEVEELHSRGMPGVGVYPFFRVLLKWVPPLRRLTFEKRKSKQNALAPPLGTSLGLGVPALRHYSAGRRDGASLPRRG